MSSNADRQDEIDQTVIIKPPPLNRPLGRGEQADAIYDEWLQYELKLSPDDEHVDLVAAKLEEALQASFQKVDTGVVLSILLETVSPYPYIEVYEGCRKIWEKFYQFPHLEYKPFPDGTEVDNTERLIPSNARDVGDTIEQYALDGERTRFPALFARLALLARLSWWTEEEIREGVRLKDRTDWNYRGMRLRFYLDTEEKEFGATPDTQNLLSGGI